MFIGTLVSLFHLRIERELRNSVADRSTPINIDKRAIYESLRSMYGQSWYIDMR